MTRSHLGYSATVEMELRTPHGTIPLSHVGPDGVVACAPTTLPPCSAEVAISIDGDQHLWAVTLPDGAQEGDTFIATAEPAARAGSAPG